MSDPAYQTKNYRFTNGGLVARYVSDKLPPGTYLNVENLESRRENSMSSRFGLQALTQNGTTNQPLGAPIHSLAKMQALGPMYRYAGAAGTLYRSGVPTSFQSIASNLSGNRMSMWPYRPAANSSPWMFIADQAQLLKDSGTGNAENWGIAPPEQPPTLQIGDPHKTIIDTFDSLPINTGGSVGPSAPTAAVSIVGTGIAWSNPTNVFALDGQVATTGLLFGTANVSAWLYASGYNLPVPANATITGIQATAYVSTNIPPYIADFRVQLVKAGAIVGANRFNGIGWTGNIAPQTYGGPTDLWGTTWTPSDINNTGFGIAYKCANYNSGNFGGVGNIDYISITVYYTIPSGGSGPAYVISNMSIASAVRAQGQLQATGSNVGIVTFTEIPPTVVSGGLVRNANVTTVTTQAAHGWATGQRIKIVNPSDPTFQVSSTVIAVTSTTTFTYANPGPNATSGGSNTVLSGLPSIMPGMELLIDQGGNPEYVMVLTVIDGVGFTGYQTESHPNPMTYAGSYLSGSIAANTLATISRQSVFDFTKTGGTGQSFNVITATRFSGVVVMQIPAIPIRNGNIITFQAPNLAVGDRIIVSGMSDSSFDGGPFTITSGVLEGSQYTIQYNQSGPNSSNVVGGTITKFFGTPGTVSDNDYFSLFINASDPFAVLEIRVAFDVGDGTFTKDYFYKSASPATWQPAVSQSLTNRQVLNRRVFDRAVGNADLRELGIQNTDLLPSDLQDLRWLRPVELNTGKTAWTQVQMMRGEFAKVGAAGSVTNGWDKVVAWQITITTQPNAGATVGIDDFLLIAGSALDSFNGNPYDYRVTFYNNLTGDESNPSITLAPSQFISPRRQPVLVTLNQPNIVTAGSGSGVSSGSGTAWSNPQNITSSINFAFANIPANGFSQNLLVESFNLNIIPGPIGTIAVLFQYFWQGGGGQVFPTIQVQLLKAGTPFGNPQQVTLNPLNQGNGGAPIPVALAFSSTGLTNTDLNNSQFGFEITATGGSLGAEIFVDMGQIEVSVDPQITHWRVYRRGGTLTQAWYLVDTVPIASANYIDVIADSVIQLNQQLKIDNDPPITSVMKTPLNATIQTTTQTTVPGVVTLGLNINTGLLFPGQLITIGVGSTQEQAYIQTVNGTQITVWLQYSHVIGETITATTRPQRPMNLFAIAFDKAWFAGDPDNPHVVYYSKTFSPEQVPPQNFIEVGTPDAPIMALVEHRGLLYAFTTKTIYQILGAGSAVPIAIPTGVKHGLVANFAWAKSEGLIWYLSYDGFYVFSGAVASYASERVEWIFKSQNFGPVPAIAPTPQGQQPNVIMAYANHEVFVSYVDASGKRHRLIYHDIYQRWRNDDSTQTDINAMNFEDDTGTFIVGGLDGNVYQDRVNDYDWGQFQANLLVPTPVPVNLQTSQMDMDIEKAYKNFNELMLDCTLNNQTLNVTLLFDNGTTLLPVGTISGSGRQQFPININNGQGQQSLNVGILITGSVTKEVIFHEVSIRYVVLGEYRESWDTYWINYGADEWHLYKQIFAEYRAPDTNGITVNVYADGNTLVPVFTFTLPSSATRTARKVRFPATKCKLIRFIGTSATPFRMYDETQIEHKFVCSGKGYVRGKISP